MGDPAGVGPELCLRLLADPNLQGPWIPLVIGDAGVLRRVAAKISMPLHARVVSADQWSSVRGELGEAAVLDLDTLDASRVVPGTVDKACGEAAFQYVMHSIDAALAGQVDAVCTGPLNKEAMQQAGHDFPGHSEIFAQRMGVDRWCMMLTSEVMTCSFVTVHVGYRDVPGLLSAERILDVIELTVEAMRRIRGRDPRLLVCGLNPHAGENGLFGNREEQQYIIPAIQAAQAQGIHVDGPLPPDTAFLPRRRETTDAFICMYHDQGHIPLKALAFDIAINTTLGLPVVRTSVDHGTAFDIAWQGKANPSSLLHAIRLAARLSTESNEPSR